MVTAACSDTAFWRSNRTQSVTPAGTETYTYDSLYRLTGATYPGSVTQSYTYDDVGNRLTKVQGGTTNYSYDNADQMTAAASVPYCYDNNGNQTRRNGSTCSAGGDTFSWDAANRLTSATIGGTTVTNTYRGDNLRHSKTVGGNTTKYTWDLGGRTPTIIQDGTYSYVYGLGLISQTDGSGSQKYFLANGVSSTEALTDGSGAVTGTAKYDVFGNVLSSSGMSTEYKFAGEEEDANLGYTYLRSSYYDPAIGRYISKEAAGGSQGGGYAYGGNRALDPMGRGPAWKGVSPEGMMLEYASSPELVEKARNQRIGDRLHGSKKKLGGMSASTPMTSGGGGGSVPARLSSTELTLACPTGLYWFARDWNPCTGTEGDLFDAYASWLVPLPMGGLSRVFMKEAGLTAQEAISAFKQASVGRRFPGQFLDSTLDEIEIAAAQGDKWAKTALKLLFNKRFDK